MAASEQHASKHVQATSRGVVTPEAVHLAFDTAGVNTRIAARVLDSFVAALVFFALEWVPADVVGLGLVLALVLNGSLSPKQAFAGFGSETVIMILGLLILTAALLNAGVVDLVVTQRTVGELAAGQDAGVGVDHAEKVELTLPLAAPEALAKVTDIGSELHKVRGSAERRGGRRRQ